MQTWQRTWPHSRSLIWFWLLYAPWQFMHLRWSPPEMERICTWYKCYGMPSRYREEFHSTNRLRLKNNKMDSVYTHQGNQNMFGPIALIYESIASLWLSELGLRLARGMSTFESDQCQAVFSWANGLPGCFLVLAALFWTWTKATLCSNLGEVRVWCASNAPNTSARAAWCAEMDGFRPERHPLVKFYESI